MENREMKDFDEIFNNTDSDSPITTNIEDVIDDSKHCANLEITRGVQEAIMCESEKQFAMGKLISPNWQSAMSAGGMHIYIPFGEENQPPVEPPTPEKEINPLYYYQEEALEILKLLVQDKFLEEETRDHYRELIINLPTGSGKTRIFLELLAWWKEFNTVVIAAPTISLLRQLEYNTKNFMEANGCDYEYKVICSDKKLSAEEMEDEEDQEIFNKMLQHGEATTNVDKIADILQFHQKKLVLLTTYKSLKKVAEAARNVGVEIDLLIGDEGHRICDSGVNQNLHKDNFPVKYKALFTATAREKISNTQIDLEYPMTNKEFFGPVAYKKTPQELIDGDGTNPGGFILPVKLLPTSWKTEYANEIKKLLEDRMIGVSDDVKHEFALFVAGLIYVYNETGKIKNITFVQSIEVADWYMRNFDIIVDIMQQFANREINIESSVISQRILGFDRVKLLNKFDEAENAIIFNYQVIKEGIDIKDCNSITWLRKMDAVGLVQSMGRTMRVDQNDINKKRGYVICPFNTDSHQKEEIIKNMKRIAELLIEEGFNDKPNKMVDENNNGNRTGRVVYICKYHPHPAYNEPGKCNICGEQLIIRPREIRDIDFGTLSKEEIVELLSHINIIDGKEVIDPEYYISDKKKAFVADLFS